MKIILAALVLALGSAGASATASALFPNGADAPAEPPKQPNIDPCVLNPNCMVVILRGGVPDGSAAGSPVGVPAYRDMLPGPAEGAPSGTLGGAWRIMDPRP